MILPFVNCESFYLLGDASPGMGVLDTGLSESFIPIYPVSLVINCTQM